MANFTWRGRDRAGQMVEGIELADSREAAVAALKRRAIQVSSIKEKGREIPIMKRFKVRRKVPQKRIALFTRQFSVMLDAGLPLVQCLEILGDQEENEAFADMIRGVQFEVEQGASLADAMRKFPLAFDDLYTNMIAAGEAGGILDIILQRLSTYIEKAVRLRNQVKSAMIYPVAVISIAVIVVWVILRFVIPVFGQLFAGVGGDMPFLTQMVIAASNFVAAYSPFLILLIVATGIFLQRYHKTHRGRRVIDGALLKVPIFGMLLKKIAIARFCRTLSTLTSSGVPILDGLEITARTSGNAIIEDSIMAVRKAVEEGKTLSEPLAQTKVFPQMVVQMIGVGEQTGALDQMLSKIADFYEDEVDTAVAGMMKLIEPLLISFLGVTIGTIVVAMYLPLYSFITQIG
ncbi:MAG: type II secretion system F family protein [Acidobacteriota bacterium]